MPRRTLAIYWGLGPREGKLASARPGAVRALPGGLGQFLAIAIRKGSKLHAHIAGFGPKWPPGTHEISTRSQFLARIEIALRLRQVPGDPANTHNAFYHFASPTFFLDFVSSLSVFWECGGGGCSTAGTSSMVEQEQEGLGHLAYPNSAWSKHVAWRHFRT